MTERTPPTDPRAVAEALPPRFTTGFAGLVGIEVDEWGEDEIRARVRVRDALKQPGGLVDGGVYATVAEDVCSVGTAVRVCDSGAGALGMSNQTSFLRPITDGHIHVVARPRHRGRTTWVWEVDFLDDEGSLCAISRMTVAVRPQRPG